MFETNYSAFKEEGLGGGGDGGGEGGANWIQSELVYYSSFSLLSLFHFISSLPLHSLHFFSVHF